MKTHVLQKVKTSIALGEWYDNKYTEMGDGWECPESEALKYLALAGIEEDKDKTLLDVGCGAGHFIQTAMKFATCHGIELSRVAVQKARERCPGVMFTVGNIEFPKGLLLPQYDYIVSIGSIEHCINIPRALNSIRQHLKDDGTFYALVPNEEWQHFDQVNETTHTDDEWKRLFVDAGFRVSTMTRTGDITHFKLKL